MPLWPDRVSIHLPSPTFQILIFPSTDEEASLTSIFSRFVPTPVGLHFNDVIISLCSSNVYKGLSCFVDQILIFQSALPDARSAPE
jgi:hypothetical protein